MVIFRPFERGAGTLVALKAHGLVQRSLVALRVLIEDRSGGRRVLIGTVLLCSWAIAAPRAAAQTLAVSPVGVQFAPGQVSAMVTLANRGDMATSFQVRVMAWHQTADRVVVTGSLQPSAAGIIASPPLGTIGPGQTQTIRLLCIRPPVSRESVYRLIIDQLPPPASPGRVRLVLRMSLPVFAEPQGGTAPTVTWSVFSTSKGTMLEARNTGTRHVSLTDIRLASAGRTQAIGAGQLPYLLAGATRRWRIGPGLRLAVGMPVNITASTDSRIVLRQVTVVAAP